MKQALLILENGKVYRGVGFGASVISYGELVFNTSMTGYTESITDPSYAGQILTFSFPLIGNYGVSSKWGESDKVHPVGIVVSELCDRPFHREQETSLSEFLEKFGKGGIAGIDTRELVKIIRQTGTMPAVLMVGQEGEKLNAAITFEAALAKVINKDEIGFLDWPSKVARTKTEFFVWQKNTLTKITETELINFNNYKKIAIIDCGVKENIIREVTKRGFVVVVVPPKITFAEIQKYNVSGVVVSNGPGDPRDYPYIHSLLKQILEFSLNEKNHLPIFGICLGHQLISCIIGAEVFKMKFGNRGVNQPVQNTLDQKAFLTSQNHSYAVRPETIPEGWESLFVNLNDGSVEGLRHKNKPIFSVQFHPEACGGPKDTNWLFDEFVRSI